MKINEVETLTGITKKNIRFYEEQGLIVPKRNAENGYREYGDEDVQTLLRIRLLRKLDVPIEEIRQMFAGTHTLGDGMRRHLITLEREQRNLEQTVTLCQELCYQDIPVSQLDTEELLSRIDRLEQSGTVFPDVKQTDIRVRYVAPAVITGVMILLMLAFGGLILWAVRADPENAPPFWFIMVLLGILASVCVGSVLALTQRIREIQKGEMDDAKKY